VINIIPIMMTVRAASFSPIFLIRFEKNELAIPVNIKAGAIPTPKKNITNAPVIGSIVLAALINIE